MKRAGKDDEGTMPRLPAWPPATASRTATVTFLHRAETLTELIAWVPTLPKFYERFANKCDTKPHRDAEILKGSRSFKGRVQNNRGRGGFKHKSIRRGVKRSSEWLF